MNESPTHRHFALTVLIGLVGVLGLPAAARSSSGVILIDGQFVEAVALDFDSNGDAVLESPTGGSIVLPGAGIRVISPDLLPGDADSAGPWWVDAGDHAGLLAGAAVRHRLPPELLVAVARAESGFDARAISNKGARGLLQLMPATALRFGAVDPLDVGQNVEAGARYLSWLLDHFDGRLDLALAGYNAGENAVTRYAGVPPYRETRNYVTRVMAFAKRYGMVTRPARLDPLKK